MTKRRRHLGLKIIIVLVVFSLVAIGSVFGVQYFTKTGLFRIPGVVYYAEDLTDAEYSTISSVFNDLDLDKDIHISVSNTLDSSSIPENAIVSAISVPVTDFYSAELDISAENADTLLDPVYQESNSFKLIPLSSLDNKKKLLSINGDYYLDEFNTGAVFRIIEFDSEKFTEEVAPHLPGLFSTNAPTKEDTLTFVQTGVTALSRGMNEKLAKVGGDATYFAKNIGEYLSKFDLTHTSNESSFTNSANNRNICSDPRFIDTLTAIGLDIVELTGNHNQDCGDEAASNTIDIYEQNHIKMVGGGKTATDAAKPLQISEKGTNITMLAFNQSTGGATYDATPGANQYYEEVATEQIKAAKARGDIVIVDIQYYECAAYASEYEDPICDAANSAAGDQIGFFRHLIDLGADIVVGTSAHQPQTFETYGNGVIYYGLGNLFFDQIWWPGTTRSLMLVHYFHDGDILQTRIVPTVYDDTMQTKLLDEETTKWFITRLAKVRP